MDPILEERFTERINLRSCREHNIRNLAALECDRCLLALAHSEIIWLRNYIKVLQEQVNR